MVVHRATSVVIRHVLPDEAGIRVWRVKLDVSVIAVSQKKRRGKKKNRQLERPHISMKPKVISRLRSFYFCQK